MGLRCSLCDGELELGWSYLDGTVRGFLFYAGFSWKTLMFRPDKPPVRNECVLRPYQRRSALRCRRCRAVLLAGKRG